jgi:predicted MPP superfamily phosphohydrolase
MMDPLLARIVLALALVGNTALAIGFLNRSHGMGAWRPLIHCCTALSLLALAAGPFIVAASIIAASPDSLGRLPNALTNVLKIVDRSGFSGLAAIYTGLCAVASVLPLLSCFSRLLRRRPAQLRSNHTTRVLLAARQNGVLRAHGIGRLAAALPGNEVFCLDVTEKTLALPRLPARLDGLSIAHLSDLHMSGRIGVGFFAEVVERTNALKPDIVAITGDIVDRTPCLSWIAETLGRLVAPYGVYCVLGNHDRQVNLSALRSALDRAGLENLGGRHRRLEIAGETLLLAGNELPWIRPAPDMDGGREIADQIPALRVLLSHSPDQIRWARRHRFDLMLAGHTHGGQIRFPLIGPLLAPSLYGTKYASGVFCEPPTLLHVSRGVSGLTPIRYNCPPEISLLRLTREHMDERAADSAPVGKQAYATWT